MTVSRQAAADLSVTLVRVVKLLHGMRQHAPRVHPAVEAAAHPVLFNLYSGARRVSELAECTYSDISTVSRQITALVGHGIAEKVTDPADGRAQLITLTEEGRGLVERLKEQRAEWLQAMLADWTAQDLAGFTAYLDRFGDALEAAHPVTVARAQRGAAPTSQER